MCRRNSQSTSSDCDDQDTNHCFKCSGVYLDSDERGSGYVVIIVTGGTTTDVWAARAYQKQQNVSFMSLTQVVSKLASYSFVILVCTTLSQ